MKTKIESNGTIPYDTGMETMEINVLQRQLKTIKLLISNDLSRDDIVAQQKDTLPR